MDIAQTDLSGVLVTTPKRFDDRRGFFSESYSRRAFDAAGLSFDFVQDNHQLLAQKGTVRGLHSQAPIHAQDKLVRCGKGSLYDVAVDVRKGSPTFGKWVGEVLSFENGKQLLVPAGFLHSFMTLEPDTEIVYKCTDYYAAECDGAVHWDSCGVAWPLDVAAPVLSDKDKLHKYLAPLTAHLNMRVRA